MVVIDALWWAALGLMLVAGEWLYRSSLRRRRHDWKALEAWLREQHQ